MIVLIGRARIQADRRSDFLAAMPALATASRQEPGCVSYGWQESVETPNQFVVVEEWESEAVMEAHLSSAHSTDFLQLLSAIVAEPPKLYRYDTSAPRSLL